MVNEDCWDCWQESDNNKMTHVYLIIKSSSTGLTNINLSPRSPWVRCCRSLESFWASSCWCYSPSPLDSLSFMERTRKTQTRVHPTTARAYSASNRAMMRSTRTYGPTITCHFGEQWKQWWMFRMPVGGDARDYICNCKNAAEKVIEVVLLAAFWVKFWSASDIKGPLT